MGDDGDESTWVKLLYFTIGMVVFVAVFLLIQEKVTAFAEWIWPGK